MNEGSAGAELMATFRHMIEWAALGIESIAVAVIVGAIVMAMIPRGIAASRSDQTQGDRIERYKQRMGKALLLALELLLAADIVRTIVLRPTLNSVAVLGVLVVVRSFLSWSLELEINGRWPWQPATLRSTK